MTSQTFREKMCLGAWHDSPFFDLDRAEKIISDNSSSLRGPRYIDIIALVALVLSTIMYAQRLKLYP